MILANYDTLMRQAPMTADVYLREAIESVDSRFGEGYAKDHPELVGTFMQVSGQDFTASVIATALQEIGEGIVLAAARLKGEGNDSLGSYFT